MGAFEVVEVDPHIGGPASATRGVGTTRDCVTSGADTGRKKVARVRVCAWGEGGCARGGTI